MFISHALPYRAGIPLRTHPYLPLVPARTAGRSNGARYPKAGPPKLRSAGMRIPANHSRQPHARQATTGRPASERNARVSFPDRLRSVRHRRSGKTDTQRRSEALCGVPPPSRAPSPDAPTDNHGKGEAFSPTDLVAAALGSCMMTLMGIAARTQGVDSAHGPVHILHQERVMQVLQFRIKELPCFLVCFDAALNK